MSEPPTTPSSSIIPHSHSHNHHHHQHQYLQQPHHHHSHHHPHHQPLPNAQPQSFITPTTTTTTTTITHLPSSSPIREYRKGNWTLPETLVLITAKKLDDERRTKASTTPPDPTKHIHQTTTTSSSTRTAELRWKWVENYCWNNGCLRSQNQCNDKWDNLLRDYKKVREYESRSEASSYWKLEKHERKERNLPTNLVLEVFEALNEVVHRRYNLKTTPSSSSNAAVDPPINLVSPPPPPPPPPTLSLPSLPPPPPPTLAAETTESSETKQSERVDSDTKRRRKGKSVGTSVMKSASVLAQTLMNCEQNKEKRHRDMIQLEERRLQIEEARNEVNRQGIAGLITAVNNLSGAIQTLVSDRPNNAGTGTGTGTGT